MFKGKSFDNFLKFSFFMFMVLTFCALGMAIYEKFIGQADKIVLGPALTFMFFAFFAKYQYAIQYWGKRLNLINEGERQRQLRLDEDTKVLKNKI
ncbi:hypothetical protein [Acinetobacter guillouiae]|uniref:hypothetical protein n=1 Tax=Acinetobacter guillouiae TaxID=106649 RepID=UPI002E1D02CF